MNKIILAVTLALVAGSAFGGALIDPVMDQQVIVQDTASSAISHHAIPLLFFLFFVSLGLIL
jgi:hypothetical protein